MPIARTNREPPSWQFDRDKFRELIVLITDKCADDASFGDTYLNKVLFFSDASAVQAFGEPITGARYQKLAHGPAPRALIPIREEMIEAGDVRVEMIGNRRVTRARRRADLTRFSKEQVELVEGMINAFRGLWAVHVSDLSHELSPGWNLVELGEDIPLESQLISTTPIPKETLQRGRDLAEQFGW